MNNRVASVLGFSFLFAYLLTFLFEGQMFYAGEYTTATVAAHFVGLFSCGFFVKSARIAKRFLLAGMGVCFFATARLFFAPDTLWLPSLIVGGYVSGCAVAAWGYFLKAFTPKHERIKTCADVLILSNILMIVINIVAIKTSLFAGMVCVVACVLAGMFFISKLPCDDDAEFLPAPLPDIKKTLRILFLFVAIITVNAGLMYQVINPAFAHLTELATWYWAVPYVVAIAIMRSLLVGKNRDTFLHVGVAMMGGAFIGFMLLGRGSFDYIVVDTLMLGAYGIFDLFWWSVLGEMLDYTDNPAKVFGIGLSANVLGILCGGQLGAAITSNGLSGAEVAVVALVVVCVTVALLPLLKRVTLSDDVANDKILGTLTQREKDVLKLVLAGKSNSAIAEELAVSDNTVKTHVRHLLAKYGVASRAELISRLLK